MTERARVTIAAISVRVELAGLRAEMSGLFVQERAAVTLIALAKLEEATGGVRGDGSGCRSLVRASADEECRREDGLFDCGAQYTIGIRSEASTVG